MIPEFGNMWSALQESDLFCITTNSILRSDGCLVMGRGIAKEAVKRLPSIHRAAGSAVMCACGSGGKYGLILPGVKIHGTEIGLFQTKYHWRDDSPVDLIKYSIYRLDQYAVENPDHRIDLNFPGIGCGRLDATTVETILTCLPDNVHVWRFR